MTSPPAVTSYRALLALPSVGRLLLGMQIARIGQSMLSITIVLFTLTSYQSPKLAGIATFFSLFPGVLVSPLAGALLDRHGRTRLVVLDYLVAMGCLSLIGVLALTHLLPAWLLIIVVAIASLTTPLSGPGLRSLFPIIVPAHLWERMNAVDSSGFVLATIVGPPLAAMLVAIVGGPVTIIIVGLAFGIAAIVIARTPEPATLPSSNGALLRDAWKGLAYTFRNPTLRGLGFSLSVLNLGGGAMNILVPLIVLNRLHMHETAVGLIFALQGVTGMISAVLFGRKDSRNRERTMLVASMVGTGIVTTLLLFEANLWTLGIVMGLTGFLNGPLDIALFTLRQRRTDPAWTGRAFTVSMSFNFLGVPLGSAAAGALASYSIETTLVLVVVVSVISGILALSLIPSKA